ncbi:MAG: amidase [Vicinamibacterales bacterium]
MTRREWLAALAGLPALHGASAASAGSWFVRGAQSIADPTTLSIRQLGEAYRTGRLTPLDVTAACLARIDRDDPALGAFVTVSRDRAVDDTRRVMRRMTAGGSPGPLAGVPIAHKDLFPTRGIRTTAGSRLHEQWVPDTDAAVVARLADAGTILVGKTNTHELGGGVTTVNPFFGTTRNPHAAERIAGGSSGGSAAAVAARFVVAATGSDTGGSVRIPAALCGCVGLKPTFGLVDPGGLVGACPTFDHVGVLTRSVEDAAYLLTAMASPAPADSATATGRPSARPDYVAGVTGAGDLTGVRVGVARDFFFAALEPAVAGAVAAALEQLRRRGAVVADVSLPIAATLYDTMFAPIAVAEIRATYAADWAARPEAFSPEFAAVLAGPGPAADEVARAREARAAFERRVQASFDDVDVLVTPTVPIVAPPIAGPIDGARILRNTWPFNAARGPAITVPCGTDGASGLPVGLQLAAAPWQEARLLRVAAAVESLQ